MESLVDDMDENDLFLQLNEKLTDLSQEAGNFALGPLKVSLKSGR